MDTVELLKGVEILSVNEGMPMSVAIFLLVLCGICCILVTGLFFYSIHDRHGGGALFSILLGVFVGFLTFIVVDEGFNPTPTYKVTIDDSVSMSEFYDRYEVINTEGKIYSIQIKEK